ncbi:MAG: YihY/virulence factor BrkB family protein [Rubrobacter sp.]
MPGLQGLGIFELGQRSARSFSAHRMTTYAAALAYRALFGLFPFVLLVITLLAVFRVDGLFEWLIDQAESDPSQQVRGPLEPAVEQGQEGTAFLTTLIEQAQEQAGSSLLSFGLAASLYSVYVVAKTLREALNAAYEVSETRSGWKRSVFLVVLGPSLAVMVIVAIGLMLIGPQLAEQLAGLVGLDEVVAVLWAWLRLPVALSLLAIVLALVFRFAPNVDQSHRVVVPGAVLAVIAWPIISLGFSFYLSNFADYGVTYGSLGAAIGLLFYLYLSACVVLAGAGINAAIYHHTLDARRQA